MKTFEWVIGGVAVVALGVAAACGGSSSTPTPTASPTPSPSLVIHSPPPTEEPPETDYRLVYREYGETQDTIWAALPSDPTHKLPLASIPHRDGFGVKATLSPDGTLLAYLSLPDSAIGPDSSQAEAYIIDFQADDQTPVLIAQNVDYNYTPFWSPDSHLLYMRQYAGPEFLAANVMIVRVTVQHGPRASATPSPTPTPSPAPGIAPAPTPNPVEVVLSDSVAHVLSFAPFGWADDGKSMFFLQEQGGTEGATLIGIYSPATTKEVDALHKLASGAWYAAQNANLQAANAAIAVGQPTPDTTITPAPTPTPDSRFVVQISDQAAFDASLSPDMQKVAYLSQEIDESGDIHNQLYMADLVQATAAPLNVPGASAGDALQPAWDPDGRLTLGVLPEDGGPGQLILFAIDGSDVTFLTQSTAGYDIPRSWAPDGTWLAVSHDSGSSLANPGDGELDVIAQTGQRETVIAGAANTGDDAIVGWIKAEAIPTPAPSS